MYNDRRWNKKQNDFITAIESGEGKDQAISIPSGSAASQY